MENLYRVLLVDDEAEIRWGIRDNMPWESLGFTLVGEGENGREALELALLLEPDLVLTDIQMPFLDGLELCRHLSYTLPATKFILFSGFDEFTYAKEAIHMNVSEYILKPINREELSLVLTQMKEKLDSERAKQQNFTLLQEKYQEHLPLLQEMFFVQLLSGRLPEEDITQTMSSLELSLSAKEYQLALCSFSGGKMGKALEGFALQQLFQDYFQWDSPWHSFFHGEHLALLLGLSHTEEVYALLEVLNRICQLSEHYLGLSLHIGLGLPYPSLGVTRS